jgi:hypothetical protein
MPSFLRLIEILRRGVLNAGIIMVPLFFSLPSNEVFETPKHIALLLYGYALAALALPLFINAWTQGLGSRG